MKLKLIFIFFVVTNLDSRSLQKKYVTLVAVLNYVVISSGRPIHVHEYVL